MEREATGTDGGSTPTQSGCEVKLQPTEKRAYIAPKLSVSDLSLIIMGGDNSGNDPGGFTRRGLGMTTKHEEPQSRSRSSVVARTGNAPTSLGGHPMRVLALLPIAPLRCRWLFKRRSRQPGASNCIRRA